MSPSTETHPTAHKPLVKPTLRGVIHHWSAVAAFGAGALLVAMAPTARSAVAAAVYALSVCALLTVSAVYHRPTWQPRPRAFMKRLDHAAIFVLIAGTYTPLCRLGLPAAVGSRLLTWVWIAAALGVLQSIFWVHAPKPVTAALYLFVGWTVVPYLGAVRAALSPAQLALLIAGGVVYSLGAVTYAARRPNPVPGVFGYHEVFHAMTVLACALHYALVTSLVRAAA
ncbi:MAG: hemolysin [Myxococcaceae bacterium]|nr:hemolysin [Myxococcaceae bacterium]